MANSKRPSTLRKKRVQRSRNGSRRCRIVWMPFRTSATGLEQLVKVGRKRRQEVRVKQSVTDAGTLSVHAVATRLDIRGRRADEALSEIVPFLDRALAAGVSRVEVVHGKGTGALRGVLHDYLATMDGVSDVSEAPIAEGGAGVTHIRFKD
ncbi:MAG: hypothetical protein EBR20_11410 [Bacteroidetes bacterium]|nr:hypothetical protein [Bacteroidota bacterium]